MNTVQSTGHASVGRKKDSQYEEIAISSSEKRNWRGIFIALLVIAAVLGLIVFSILLLSPELESARLHGKRISLFDVKNKQYQWNENNGTWLNNRDFVFINPDGGLSVLNVQSLYVTVLMNNSTFRQLNVDKYVLSPDLNYVLLYSDPDSVKGTSYYIYEFATTNSFPLSPREGDQIAPKLQYVLWAPKPIVTEGLGEKSFQQGVAFVYDNDIYYKPKVQNDLICRITTTGKNDYILNGIPDWLYSNVVELRSDTLMFSPDGQYLSFLSFNISQVSKYQYMWYGDEMTKYPTVKSIRYPKANTANPNVTVYVVNLSVLKYIFPKTISIPKYIGNDSYIGGMVWLSATDLSITYTDRNQSVAHTLLCKAPNFICSEIFAEREVEKGWVLIAEKPLFITTMLEDRHHLLHHHHQHEKNLSSTTSTSPAPHNGTVNATNETPKYKKVTYLIKRLPVRDGGHGFFRHVVLVPLENRRKIPLTMGQYEVTEILGYDEKDFLLYFMAAPYRKPGQRHLYKILVQFDGTNETLLKVAKEKLPYCMTCENEEHSSFDLLRNNNDTYDTYQQMKIPNNCLYNKIYFNSDFTYYVQECLGPESPSLYMVEASSGKRICVLDNGNHLRERLDELSKPQIMTFSVEIKYDFNAQVKLFLPPGVKEDDDALLPLILQIDGTPESQLVSEKFSFDWNWYLCSYQQYIIAQIDARGSGFQGESLRTQIRGKVGIIEVEDQLAVLTYLRDNLKVIDPNRICAYGWGYGAYIVSMMIASDSENVLRCGAAIQPIVSFKYHNSFFTERYVALKTDNGRAVLDSDLSLKAGNFVQKNYLLIHSTADNFIHQQHGLTLTKALIEQGVMFRHQIYTDEEHDLNGVVIHVYRTIESYFEENFGNLDSLDWATSFFISKT